MTDDEIVQRGAEAQALLSNALLMVAMANVRNDAVDAWMKLGVRDVEGREQAWYMAKCADAVKVELENYISEARGVEMKRENERKLADQKAREAQAFRDQYGMDPPKNNGVM